MTRDQANHIAQAIMDDIELSGTLSKSRIAETIQTASIRYRQYNAVTLASKIPNTSRIRQWTDSDGVVYMQPISKD